MAGGVRCRFTAPEPWLLLGVSEPPHPAECDCDPSATRRYRCRWSSARAPPQGPASELHHGVHEHQPPGTSALLSLSKEPGRGRCGEGGGGERKRQRPCPGPRQAGPRRPSCGEGALPERAGLAGSRASPSVWGTLDLLVTLKNKPAELGRTGQISPIRKSSSFSTRKKGNYNYGQALLWTVWNRVVLVSHADKHKALPGVW